MPLVSVITPMFNSAETIAETLASIQAQTFADWEALVVDDRSTDDGPERVRAVQDADPRVRLLQNRYPKGAAGARNTGIDAVRGRYVAFLDSDDLWRPDKLAVQLEVMRATGAALSCSAYEILAESGARRVRSVPSRIDHAMLLRRNYIGCLTAMYDRERVGLQRMPELRMRQDWGLWLRIVRETGEPAVGIDAPLATLRLRRGSLSRNKLVAVWYNFALLRRHEGIGRLRSALYVLEGGVRALRGQ